MQPSRWPGRRGRPVRVCRYDALHHDGRVETDARLTVMYRRSPADFEVVSRTVHDHCPEVGTGAWVGAAGDLVDGPGPVDHPGRRVRNGRRAPWPPLDRRRDPRRVLLWRAGLGAVAVVTGVLVLVGTGGAGLLAALGALTALCGSAALATTLPGGSRRR